jgi:hypothetical protein
MLKEFQSYIDNTGRKVFEFDCIVDGQRRPRATPPAAPAVDADNQSANDEDEEAGVHVSNAAASAEDGLVRDVWRLISCVEAYPTTGFFLPQCVDYGHAEGKVLRQAIPLINASNPDLMWNHSLDAKDVAGHVEKARWEKSADIPPGVNATVVVDPEYDAKAAKGLSSGHLRNGSIGLSMRFTKSHPDMEDEDFYSRQGEMVDGDKVRWLPEKITSVRHMALVAAGTGADPNAGRRTLNSADNTATANPKPKETGMEKLVELLKSVLDKLAIDAIIDEGALPESVAERVSTKLDNMVDANDKYNTLAASVQAIGAIIKTEGEADLTAAQTLERLPAILALADQGKRLVEFKVKEACDWFEKARFSPEKTELTDAEKRQKARIESLTDLDHLADLIADYKELAEAKFDASRKVAQNAELPGEPKSNYAYNGVDLDVRESSSRLFKKEEK